MIRALTTFILIIAVLSQSAFAIDQTCMDLLTTSAQKSNEIQQNQTLPQQSHFQLYRRFKLLKMSDLFPEVEKKMGAQATIVEQVKITPEYEARFRAAFDQFMDYLEHFEGYKNAPKFRKWLATKTEFSTTNSHKVYPRLNPLDLRYLYYDYTLEQYFDVFHGQYLEETVSGKYHSHVQQNLARKAVAWSGRKVATFAKWSLNTFLLFGLAVPMVQVIPRPLMDPLVQQTEQTSRSYLDIAVQEEMSYLSTFSRWLTSTPQDMNPTTTDLIDVTKDLRNENFDKMTPKEKLEVWKTFDERYALIFNRRNKTLAPNQQAGRDQLKGYLLDIPMNHASMMSVFRTQYMVAQGQLNYLNDKIASRNTTPTTEEIDLIRMYKAEMHTSEKRLANSIASFLLVQLMFKEVGHDLLPHEKQAQWDNTELIVSDSLEIMAQNMDFKVYTEEVADLVEQAIHSIDPAIPYAGKIAHDNNRAGRDVVEQQNSPRAGGAE